MIVSKSIQRRYDEIVAYAPALMRLVREVLGPYCERNHFAFHDRIKTVESVAEKLESGRVSGWDSLDDLYAATIVVPTLRDEPRVLSEMELFFDRADLRTRATAKTSPDVFRFDCPRFYGRLKGSEERAGSAVGRIKFEVQVRTAFEHAWSFTTHSITYKSDYSDWRRLRLAAMIRAGVEQIDLALAGFEQTAAEVLPGKWEESEVKLRLLTRFMKLFADQRLPSEIRPAAWSRFVDNFYALCQAEAKRRGSQVAVGEVVDEAIASIESWSEENPPARVPRSLSLFQTSFGILCAKRVILGSVRFSLFGAEDVLDVFPQAKGIASKEL